MVMDSHELRDWLRANARATWTAAEGAGVSIGVRSHSKNKHRFLGFCCTVSDPKIWDACATLAAVQVQVEGSGKWPDDEEASGKLRSALGCQIAQALESQFGVHARAAEGYVDVRAQGFVLRLRLWSDRDDALAERAARVRPPSLTALTDGGSQPTEPPCCGCSACSETPRISFTAYSVWTSTTRPIGTAPGTPCPPQHGAAARVLSAKLCGKKHSVPGSAQHRGTRQEPCMAAMHVQQT